MLVRQTAAIIAAIADVRDAIADVGATTSSRLQYALSQRRRRNFNVAYRSRFTKSSMYPIATRASLLQNSSRRECRSYKTICQLLRLRKVGVLLAPMLLNRQYGLR